MPRKDYSLTRITIPSPEEMDREIDQLVLDSNSTNDPENLDQ